MKAKHNTQIYRLVGGLFLLILSVTPSLVWSQSAVNGSVESLKANNGFGNLVLGHNITELPAQNLTYLDGDSRVDPDSCLKYQYNDDKLLTLGDSLSLDAIGLRTYQNKIVNVYLFFKMQDAYKVLSNFLNAYGPCTSRPDAYSDIYNWDTSQLSLSLRYQVKTEIGVAIFTSKEMENTMAADKYSQSLKTSYQSISALQ
ncbi:hypothetical protein AAFN85_07025 [Mucilaginibacter sp. CAU 1740]|uniref:hypothetical protein n=1 Tax=Mucilaginibacter sp. CAU 1740 TaxID=3140365 RepID=UPI00325B8D34